MILKFKRLYADAILPAWGHGDDQNAGLDFYAHFDRDDKNLRINKAGGLVLMPLCSAVVGTGVAWEPGFATYDEQISDDIVREVPYQGWKPAMILKGRSGLAIQHGIEATNAGVIDANYRGEIMVRLINTGMDKYIIHMGDRIAQGIVVLLPVVEVAEVSAVSSTSRGGRGFGSSGR